MLKVCRDFVTNFAGYQSFSTLSMVLDLRLSQWWLKSMVFWVVKLCSLGDCPVFSMNVSPLPLGLNSKPSKTLASIAQLTICFCWFITWLALQPWILGSIFNWNLGLSPNYMMLQPRIRCSSSAMLFQFVIAFRWEVEQNIYILQ
jgi:hypothetical protein